MALSLSSVGYGTRSSPIELTSILLLASTVASFLVIGAVWAALSVAESLVGQTPTVIIAAAVVIYFAAKDLGLPLRVPYRKAQLPLWVRDHFSSRTTFAVFGAMLGAGFLTPYTTSLHTTLVVGGAVSGRWTVIAAGAGAFAVGKAIVLLAAPPRQAGPDDLSRFDELFPIGARSVRLIPAAAAGLSLAAASALIMLWR